jgi:cell division transport system permease protein
MMFREGQPILSLKSAPLVSLGVTMTVMCFLACLAVIGLLLINRAVENWDKGLSREVTVQIEQLSAVDMDKQLAKARSILQMTPGVTNVEILDKSVGVKLLEPWLGRSGIEDLPIPRLIRVTIDEAAPPDYDALRASLESEVQGVALDTHGRWRDELSRGGAKMSALAIAILVLISLASMTLSAFGARAALESNREIVEVLRLIGAENRFIAGEINRRFFYLGLLSGCLGCLLALAGLFLLGWSGQLAAGHMGNTLEALYSVQSLGWNKLSYVFLVPLLSSIFVAVAARLTLMRLLEES